MTEKTKGDVVLAGSKGAKEGGYAAMVGLVSAFVIQSMTAGAERSALVLWPESQDLQATAIMTALGIVLVKFLRRLVLAKTGVDLLSTSKFALPFVLCVGLCACATTSKVTTSFSETIVDAETGDETTTTYDAKSKAGFLGELDVTSHDWQYVYGGEENMITTGQVSEGIDNTAQTAITDVLSKALDALASMAQVIAAVAFPAPVPEPPAPQVDVISIGP